MKTIAILIVFISVLSPFTPNTNPTSDDFLGTWEWVDGNQIFRINFFNELDGDGTFSLGGHFTMVEVDSSANETIIYTSNRLIEGTNQYWIPMINGGGYLDYIDSL